MNIIEKIQRIKYLRLKPEERFLIDILDKVEFVYNNEYPKSEFYRVDGEILFEQDSKNRRFWVHFDKIWLILESDFNLNNKEIRELIQCTVWERLKRKVDTPSFFASALSYMVWERLKRKVDTPRGYAIFYTA